MENPADQSPSTIAEIDKLLDHHTCAETAAILRSRGLANGEGRPFTATMIQRVIRTYQLRTRRQRLLDAGMLTLTEMAALLDVSTGTVKIWHHAGLITGHPYNDKGQCLYPPPGPNPPARAQGRKLSQRRPPHPPTPNTASKMSDPTGTVSTRTTSEHRRIDPKRCSMQPEVSLVGSAAGSSPPRYRHRPGRRQRPW